MDTTWAGASIWIAIVAAVLIYNLAKLRFGRDAKDELLKLKKLCDEGIITEDEYETSKKKLLKRMSI